VMLTVFLTLLRSVFSTVIEQQRQIQIQRHSFAPTPISSGLQSDTSIRNIDISKVLASAQGKIGVMLWTFAIRTTIYRWNFPKIGVIISIPDKSESKCGSGVTGDRGGPSWVRHERHERPE